MSNSSDMINRVEELEAELHKLKEVLMHEQDEPEIPDFPEFDVNGEAFWWINNALDAEPHRGRVSGYVEDYNYFHAKEYADELAKNCKIIAMMLHCKWYLDREYEPDWENEAEKKWFVCCKYRSENFVTDYEFLITKGHVYFSSEKTAQKCAEWMNEHWVVDSE